MAASRARLEALLARVQKRANEPRAPSAAVAPILEAVKGGASRAASHATAATSTASSSGAASDASASASVRGVAGRGVAAANAAAQNALTQNALTQSVLSQNALAQNEIGDEDIEEYDEELIEIIDDSEVIPHAAAAARAIEPAAFGAAVDRRPSAPIRSDSVSARPASARQAADALRPEAVAARPVAATEVARARGTRRELRHTSFVELLDASLKLG